MAGFGAVGAAVFDRHGPTAARPLKIPTSLVAEFEGVRAGVGPWDPVEIGGGLVAI